MSRKTAWALLLLLPCAWFHPLLRGFLPDFMDTVAELYPMRAAAARQLWSGEFPLWLPNIFCGVPLAANPQVGVFYPPQWIYFAWPHAVSNGLVLLFHYWLAGFGMWRVCRSWGVGALPALFAGLILQFGSYMVSRMALTPHLYTGPWLLWAIAALEPGFRRGWSPRVAAAAAVPLAMLLLAGSPQLAFYCAIFLAGYTLLRSAAERRWAGLPQFAALAAALPLMLAAIQLMPTAEFLRHSARNEIPVQKLAEQGLNGGFVLGAVIGGTGETVEDTDSVNAIGTGALLLVPLALLHRRLRARAAILIALGGVHWLLSLGALAEFWASWLPLYGKFHAPRRALIVWSIVGPLAAACGAQWVACVLRAKLRRRGRLAAAVALAALAWPTAAMLPRLERQFADPSRYEPPPYAALLGGDRFATIDPTFRYSYHSRTDDFGFSMLPDMAALHGTFDAQGYDPLVPARMAMLADEINRESGRFYPTHGIFHTDPGHPLLAMLNVQFIAGRWDLLEPARILPGTRWRRDGFAERVELVASDPMWPLWRFKERRPLAWVAREAVPAESAEQAIALAAANDIRQFAFVEEALALPRLGRVPEAAATRRGAGGFDIALSEPAADFALVCVASTWFPGWRAVSDSGERLRVVPANGAILGVVVPPGTASIALRYRPGSVLAGLAITLAGVLALMWARRRG